MNPPRPRRRRLPPFLPLLFAATLAAQSDEFSASGKDVVRIESELKLKVAREATEPMWRYLSERYGKPAWLNREGHTFTATLGDEEFEDVYFDTPALVLLERQCGVRHRSRFITEGSAMRKDGRQLMQLKLARGDGAGVERSEIKYEIQPSRRVRGADDAHAMIGRIKPEERAACIERLTAYGIDPWALGPMLTVHQNRRRVYVADQHGPFATLTLDMVSAADWFQTVRFTELELELNEIRFTEADAATRATMNRVIAAIEADVIAAFPGTVRDQTPKYNKAFFALEAGAPLGLPVRWLVQHGVTADAVLCGAVGLAVALAGGVLLLVRRRRTRAQQQQSVAKTDVRRFAAAGVAPPPLAEPEPEEALR